MLVDFRLNIFASKVSNLLLPFGVEGAGRSESNPTSEAPNKYFYDAFLMMYFVVVFYHFLALDS